MNDINLIYIFPEIFLLISICIILLIDTYLLDTKRMITYSLSLLTLTVCGLFTFKNYSDAITIYAFNNMFITNSLTVFLKLLVYLITGVAFFYSRQYNNDYLGGKFYVLALFSVLGQMVMISSNSFLSIYLGLELMSLSLYALIALRRNNVASTEAAIKYFCLGALASGFLLYGISMLYGVTSSFEINTVFRFIEETHMINHQILIFGTVFIVAGLAFKLSLVPFHMWIPDVYHGAATPTILLLSSTPKLAIFAIMFHSLSEGLLLLAIDWQKMLIILAVLSIIIGNITAIAQTNIKRMLAYSTISHMGFMLLGMLSGVIDNNLYQTVYAYSSSLFYIISYVITTIGIFGVILLFSTSSGFTIENLEDFKGLNQRSPFFAIIMFILMFSMAGIPPTIGFYAKFYVLQTALNAGHIWLLIIIMIFSVIGAFYYLRIIKLMYFDAPMDNKKIVINLDARLILSLNALIILFIGIWPTSLIEISNKIILSTLVKFVSKIITT